MNLYLVRHAEAAGKSEDRDSNLTDKGKQDAVQLARVLKPLKLKVAAVWHSGKPRAVQTADAVASALSGSVKPVRHRGLKPNASVKPIIKAITRLTGDLMIVGHEPFLGKLAAQLVCGSDCSLLDLAKPSIVCLNSGNDGVWRITWMISPSVSPVT
jgi:phosphohistidine phosphatase